MARRGATKTARLGTPYCGALWEQNLYQCEACFKHACMRYLVYK